MRLQHHSGGKPTTAVISAFGVWPWLCRKAPVRAALCAALGAALCVLCALPAAAFDLQGHRGTRGHAPENTLPAFAKALSLGVNTLELDLQVTRDGVVVIAHDAALNPDLARDAQGQWITPPGAPIRTLTWSELQRYDVGRLNPQSRYAKQWPEQQPRDGTHVPQLAELFGLVRARRADSVRFNIELKRSPLAPELSLDPDAFAALALKVIGEHGMAERVTIQSFDWSTLRATQRLALQMHTVALTARQPWLNNVDDARWTAGLQLAEHGGSVPRLVKAIGAATWSPYHGDLSEATLAEAHALGLRVVPWTVNEPAVIDRLLAWGVDGLISDYPDRLRAALARRGLPLPTAWP